jgi:Serpin (serine protease inhibitor)
MQQTRFLNEWVARGRGQAGDIPELAALGSSSGAEMDRFLRQHGFSATVDELGPAGIGLVGVLDLSMNWQEAGTSTSVQAADGDRYAAARISGSAVTFWRAASYPDPVVEPATIQDDAVYVTPLAGSPAEFDLVALVQCLEKDLQPAAGDESWDGVVFPKVVLDRSVDLAWLIGLESCGHHSIPLRIARALQRTRLQVDETGAQVQSAAIVELLVLTAPPRSNYVIDRPFLLWIRRPGLTLPLGVFHLTEETWRDPARGPGSEEPQIR